MLDTVFVSQLMQYATYTTRYIQNREHLNASGDLAENIEAREYAHLTRDTFNRKHDLR